MAVRKRTSTTRLPQSILEEINAQSGASSSGHRRASGTLGRKAERKAERQIAKQRKAQFFTHGAPKQNVKRSAATETKDGPSPRKKVKFDLPIETTSSKAPRGAPLGRTIADEHAPTRKKTAKSKEREAGPSSDKKPKRKQEKAVPVTTKMKSRTEEEEDAYIAMLERRLGIRRDKKGKNKYGSGFEGDGFLDLLVDLDEKVLDGFGEDDTEEFDNEMEVSDEQEDPQPDSESDVSNEEQYESGSEGEWAGLGSEVFDSGGGEHDMNDAVEKAANETDGQLSGSKYVPPHLRKQDAAQKLNGSEEIDAKLVRQLKGLLNRLSEQNMDFVLKQIEDLYRSHRRHDITSALTSLIIEGTCSHSILLDSYVALHAGLVACLHKIIGVEFAAYFVQSVVSSFERHYNKTKEPHTSNSAESNPDGDDGTGKECSNLLVLLSDLYNYHVISCTLVYDIIRLILEGDISELDVELILKIARGSGSQLRQDDPSALKDIIQIVQSKLGDQRGASSRTRFMVETLINLKNNKLKKAAPGAHGGNEAKEQISKFVTGIGKKYQVQAHEPLRISLDDLRQAGSKGKWWLVGAAWGGDPLVEQRSSLSQSATNSAENALLTLAKKQGMNTDVRRSVFVVLMSSDDYVDACDRLAQLNLTEVQQREIIRVLLHCCGNEKSYNPYYTLIAAHLCKQSHNHRVTLQYCFWDFLRSLGETNVGGADMSRVDEDGEGAFELDRISGTRMANISQVYAWLVAKGCVAITILKTLDFFSLKGRTKIFLKQFFLDLFVNTQDPSTVPGLGNGIDDSILTRRDKKAIVDVMSKASRVPMLSFGIVHFLSKTFIEGDSQYSENSFVNWCCRVSTDVLQDGTGVQ